MVCLAHAFCARTRQNIRSIITRSPRDCVMTYCVITQYDERWAMILIWFFTMCMSHRRYSSNQKTNWTVVGKLSPTLVLASATSQLFFSAIWQYRFDLSQKRVLCVFWPFWWIFQPYQTKAEKSNKMKHNLIKLKCSSTATSPILTNLQKMDKNDGWKKDGWKSHVPIFQTWLGASWREESKRLRDLVPMLTEKKIGCWEGVWTLVITHTPSQLPPNYLFSNLDRVGIRLRYRSDSSR